MVSHSKKVFITGIDGFTGKYLKRLLISNGFEVFGTTRLNSNCDNTFAVDLTNKQEIKNVLKKVEPDFIVHLAAISFVGHADSTEFYRVNVIGTENLLSSALGNNLNPDKIIIASSANIYGNSGDFIISEGSVPEPINHYACSKLAMENIVKTYFSKFNIIITRPFNYTGNGQETHFLVPKIVSHFKDKKPEIELGNIDVARDYSSVEFVVESYLRLLTSPVKSEVVNICSGTPVSLEKIISTMESIANYKINVRINSNFVRKDEIKTICGDNTKLFGLVGTISSFTIETILKNMYTN